MATTDVPALDHSLVADRSILVAGDSVEAVSAVKDTQAAVAFAEETASKAEAARAVEVVSKAGVPLAVEVGAPAVVEASAPAMIRDPRLDQLLAVHRQFGGAGLLQTSSGFLRNATFEAPGR